MTISIISALLATKLLMLNPHYYYTTTIISNISSKTRSPRYIEDPPGGTEQIYLSMLILLIALMMGQTQWPCGFVVKNGLLILANRANDELGR